MSDPHPFEGSQFTRVDNLTPWSAKLADAQAAGYALGEAKLARPDLFSRT